MLGGASLSEPEAREMVGQIMDGALSGVQAAGLLTALAARGESISEVVGAARAMRERSLHVEHGLPLVIDVCGTGGDAAGTINVSTIVAFVVAACGVPVAKHGNRAASSACGSADVLEAAHLPIDVDPDRAARMLQSVRFAFLFAPRYHPAMKTVGPVRRELGVRTIFNVLGPLTNPAGATHQIVGVATEAHVELVGEALRQLGLVAGAVVHGSGVDEVVGDRPTLVYQFDAQGVRRWVLEPAEHGLSVPLEQLAGGSKEQCVAALDAVLQGERSGRAEVIALNAGLALHVSGKAARLEEGVEMAREALASGRAYETFRSVKAYSIE